MGQNIVRIDVTGRRALPICAVLAALTACGGGGGTPLSPSPAGVSAERTGTQPAYSVIYRFKGSPGDGANPAADLFAGTNGELYGTTRFGGTGSAGGRGTVFEMSSSGTESILYSFRGGADGEYPFAPVIAVKDVLYGVTEDGGGATFCDNGCGTVFELTPSSSGYSEQIIHTFQGGKEDGAFPQGLVPIDGVLYGTTAGGGDGLHVCTDSIGCGTVFKLISSSSGYAETVLYRFKGGADGGEPLGQPLDVKGSLYGTTWWGGMACSCGGVFEISPAGKERVLYRFKGGTDGDGPVAGLINVNGTLYGTTAQGGASNDGTVFKITTSGKESVLYSFKGGTDGASPQATLTNVNGTLYGSTTTGGGTGCPKRSGCGTVFKITRSGAESVLYSFKGGVDGSRPFAGLANLSGTLYGTTYGGHRVDRYGTLFALTP